MRYISWRAHVIKKYIKHEFVKELKKKYCHCFNIFFINEAGVSVQIADVLLKLEPEFSRKETRPQWNR